MRLLTWLPSRIVIGRKPPIIWPVCNVRDDADASVIDQAITLNFFSRTTPSLSFRKMVAWHDQWRQYTLKGVSCSRIVPMIVCGEACLVVLQVSMAQTLRTRPRARQAFSSSDHFHPAPPRGVETCMRCGRHAGYERQSHASSTFTLCTYTQLRLTTHESTSSRHAIAVARTSVTGPKPTTSPVQPLSLRTLAHPS